MTLKPMEDIGVETHEGHDQFFRIEEGEADVTIGEETFVVRADEAFVVPSGALHNVVNRSTDSPLKLYTIYAPAEHPDGVILKDKPAT